MTVADLIAKLQALPPTARVVHPETSHGAFYVTAYVEADDAELHPATAFDCAAGVETADIVVIT